jgi:diguanylate cyclase (GGDEF)-like protein
MNEQSPQKILIVDDTEENIKMLNNLLHEQYEVYFATKGEDAIKIAQTENPDLILLDIIMPEMDGYEVCRRLKSSKQFRHVPIVFVTAMSDRENEAKGLALGAIDYITKPFSPAIVEARIKNHLELKRHRDFLEMISSKDGLTGIANRRRFEEFFELEWRRAMRNGSHLSLVMMDVDLFKQYNDNYGHIAGDECLKKITITLAANLNRPSDLVARYGGEEFVCVLPKTDIEGALHIANRFLEKVSELGIPHDYSNATDHVTLSLGVATIIPGDLFCPEDLIKVADECLYEAKQCGRNKVKSKKLTE